MNPSKKILVIRNDKIGDFMLSWPAFALLKKQYPDAEVTALVPKYTVALAEQCRWIDKILIDDKQDGFIKDILTLTKKIKGNNYDATISLFTETRTALSLWLAGVKKRTGPATKLAQIFTNNTLRQHRSQSIKPEYEYNLDLIRYYIKKDGQVPRSTPGAPFLTFDREETRQIKSSLLHKHDISDDVKLVIIHPGTGGSAINLRLENYAQLVNCIADRNKTYFIITAGPDELTQAENLSTLVNAPHHVHYSTGGLIDFCKLISVADVFISGSTGPLHIAGALNIRTVAFYPSRKSATALRWQTLNDTDRRLAFTIDSDTDVKTYSLDMKSVCDQVCDTYLHGGNSSS
jgi:ADP-heptose:LPS heptosyltransferase